tara:strand:+ start:311 stop:604 length:294 start_codon:yes stop_codon:yes gene_type:complete
MNEVITILTSGSGNQIAKVFVGPVHVQQRFSICRLFAAHEGQVSDLRSLSTLLQKLEYVPTQTIIKGVTGVGPKQSYPPQQQNLFSHVPPMVYDRYR